MRRGFRVLPSELLRNSVKAGQAYPFYLKGEKTSWAAKVLQVINERCGQSRGDLDEALKALEGDSPDYQLVRGLSHLVLADANFTIACEIEPEVLREDAFLLATKYGHGTKQREQVLQELLVKHNLPVETIPDALYADLPENHILTGVPETTAEKLVDLYNLAQAQGLLYYAKWLVIHAYRNEPGEYRRLFHRLKLYGLMYAVEGNLEDGYRIHVDGPASLFHQTRRYGVKMAAFLPALLQLTRWAMEAELEIKGKKTIYALTSESALKSHFPKPPIYDSLLESSFVERWSKTDTAWVIEREVEIVDLKGTVFVPDFALRHPDGRVNHVEIVGFWHPDYLKRKFDKARKAGMKNLLLAVSDRLNVTDEHLTGLAGPVIFFKGKLEPKAVLEVIENIENIENPIKEK